MTDGVAQVAHAPQQGGQDQALVFTLSGQRYALSLTVVERVVRAVAVTPVPEAPCNVLGLINLAGRVIPVLSLRRCLGLPDRPVRPEDQFVIARVGRRTVAVVVDEVEGLRTLAEDTITEVEEVLPGLDRHILGLAKTESDILLIYDLEKLSSQEELDRILDPQPLAMA